MRNLVLALLFGPATAMAEPACLILDPAQAAQPDGAERSLGILSVGLEDGAPGPGKASFLALFAGPSVEAPKAKAGVVYSQSFTCAAGPAEVSGPPYWLMPGGVICTPSCGKGMVQIRSDGDGFAFWMEGLVLTEDPGGACGEGTPFTTRGNVGVGYSLVVSDNAEHCAPVGENE